jgi:hypothetical protein
MLFETYLHHKNSKELMKKIQRFICICLAVSGAVALLWALGMFFIFQPHLPSWKEIKFKWNMEDQLDSPAHIRQLTDFEWQKICLRDNFDWFSEDPLKGHYVLAFFDKAPHPIAEFYISKIKSPNLELHIGHCFAPDQKVFHKIGEMNGK